MLRKFAVKRDSNVLNECKLRIGKNGDSVWSINWKEQEQLSLYIYTLWLVEFSCTTVVANLTHKTEPGAGRSLSLSVRIDASCFIQGGFWRSYQPIVIAIFILEPSIHPNSSYLDFLRCCWRNCFRGLDVTEHWFVELPCLFVLQANSIYNANMFTASCVPDTWSWLMI